jgi:hypothetical protein
MRKETAMARDRSGSAILSSDELAAGERAGRKRLGRNGCPEDQQPSVKPPADEATDNAVPENEEPGLIESMRGM